MRGFDIGQTDIIWPSTGGVACFGWHFVSWILS
jgi:hypothetical protein